MAEYGNGLRLAEVLSKDKERIKEALKGRLVCDEDENGFKYDTATQEECIRFILNKFDQRAYELFDAYAWQHIFNAGFNKASGLEDKPESMQTEAFTKTMGGMMEISSKRYELMDKFSKGYEFEPFDEYEDAYMEYMEGKDEN